MNKSKYYQIIFQIQIFKIGMIQSTKIDFKNMIYNHMI